jgi:hypothetical protein
MKWWRLVVAAGLLAGAVLAVRPASAEDEFAATDETASGGDVWEQIGWGALTGLSNLLYVPAKLAYAGLGGLTGGLALGLTGGDLNTAESIWEPSLKGDYFLTPGMIQGQDPISFAGAPAGLTGEVPEEAPATVPPRDPRGDS